MDKKDGEPNDCEKSPNSIHAHDDPEDMGKDIISSEDCSDSDSEPELSKSGVSFEESDHISAAKEQSLQGRRRRTPNDSEDDGTEGSKRMRGLEDLGMGVVVSSLKRKQSPVAHVHEFLKRKNRHRPLTKVLESTMMVTVPVMCEELPSPTGSYLPGASDSKVSDSTGILCENGISINASEHARDAFVAKCKPQENEISSTMEYTENGSCDRLFDVPLIAEENHSAASLCTSQKAQTGTGAQSSQSSRVEAVSVDNEELNESGSTSSGTADMNTINQRMEKGASKWQLKGKRNSRNTSKSRKQESRSVDVDEKSDAIDQDVFSLSSGKSIDGNSVGGSVASDSTYRIVSRPVTEIQVDEFRGWGRSQKEPQGKASELPQRLLPYRQSRFTVNPKYDPSDFSLRHHTAESSLYDVNVEVKASYRPHHVPYISLMSKLNGRPIIGHPLTVEVLDDGFCDSLMSSSVCYSSSYELDDLGEDSSALQGVDMVYEKRTNSRGRTLTRNHTFQPHVSPTKSRKNGVLSKKIRKLSSLTGSHKQTDEEKKPVMEKLKGPSVACVPLKVVFSRINAALNGSIRPIQRLLAPTDT